MILNMKICNNLTIDSLNDLVKLKILEEVGTTKINKSKVARDLGIDRRTVSKYMNGYVKKVNRERKSSIDEYYDVIKDLLDDRSSQVFFYKRVLWQYLKDNHGLKCAQSSFRRWISKHEEFQSYFNGSRNRMINGQKRNSYSNVHVIHYETEAGYEAQLDWL